MSETPQTNPSQPDTVPPATAGPTGEHCEVTVKEKHRYAWLALLSLVSCITAWFAATRSGYAAVAACAVSIISGAFALGSHRGAVRNTAITFIIASAVLLIVVGAFMIALHKLLQ